MSINNNITKKMCNSIIAAFVISFLLTSSFVGFATSGSPDECNALLQFKNSLEINYRIRSKWLCQESGANMGMASSKTASWKEGTDCCAWDGITCDYYTGTVIEVNLTCSYLQGTLHSNSSLFSSLHQLQSLHLGGNNLTEPIPSSICQKGSLTELVLVDNNLSGPIPLCLGNLSNLNFLVLSYNQLEGPLPRTLANCTSLEYLDVNENQINDTFPFWMKSLPLRSLRLGGNNFHGPITSGHATFPFPHLHSLLISNNRFHGRLPPDYFRLSSLTLINLYKNMFDGFLPVPPSTAEAYVVSGNKFTGEIPSSFCNITTLILIMMSNNILTGKIPQCLIDVNADLALLDLSMNRFRGPIPEILALEHCSLQSIVLSGNHLGGKLPRSWASCKQLNVLDIGDNEVEDTFPSWIETLPNLYALVIRANNFHGPICNPTAIHLFPRLHIFDISSNNFSGTFPSKYMANFNNMMSGDEGRGVLKISADGWDDSEFINMIYKGVPTELIEIQKALVVIDLSHNHFQGEMPEVIGNLQSLIGLNLSHNNFRGGIPSSLGNLTQLEWLDLSSNSFTGEIPTALTNLTSLAIFNVSMNQLKGQIPLGKQFDSFGRDSFNGNPDLCGHPLQKPCSEGHQAQQKPPSASQEQDEEDTETRIEYRAVLMGLGCGIVIGLSTGYILIETRRLPAWLINMVGRKRTRTTSRARKSSPGTYGSSHRPQ